MRESCFKFTLVLPAGLVLVLWIFAIRRRPPPQDALAAQQKDLVNGEKWTELVAHGQKNAELSALHFPSPRDFAQMLDVDVGAALLKVQACLDSLVPNTSISQEIHALFAAWDKPREESRKRSAPGAKAAEARSWSAWEPRDVLWRNLSSALKEAESARGAWKMSLQEKEAWSDLVAFEEGLKTANAFELPSSAVLADLDPDDVERLVDSVQSRIGVLLAADGLAPMRFGLQQQCVQEISSGLTPAGSPAWDELQTFLTALINDAVKAAEEYKECLKQQEMWPELVKHGEEIGMLKRLSNVPSVAELESMADGALEEYMAVATKLLSSTTAPADLEKLESLAHSCMRAKEPAAKRLRLTLKSRSSA